MDLLICMIASPIILYILRIGVFYLDTYLSVKDGGCRFRISYNEFKSFYDIRPECYDLWTSTSNGPCVKYILKADDDYAYIYFKHFTDWIKVKRMFYKLRKEEKKQEELKSIDKFLASTKKDKELLSLETSELNNLQNMNQL